MSPPADSDRQRQPSRPSAAPAGLAPAPEQPTNSRPTAAREELLRRQLAWYFLLRVIFITLVLGITAVLEVRGHRLTTDFYHYPLLFIAAVYLFTISSAMLLGRLKKTWRFASLQVGIDIMLLSFLVLFSGTSQSLFTVVYFLPIIAAGFMLFTRGALLTAALCTFAYGFLLLLEYGRHDYNLLIMAARPEASLERLLNLFAIYGLSFFLVAALAGTLAMRLYRTETALSQTASRYDRLSSLYKQIFDDITTGIVTVDSRRRITSINRAAEEICGWPAYELVGKEVAGVLPEIGSPTEASARNRAEADISRRDGDTVPVGYSWSRLYGSEAGGSGWILSLQDLSLIREMENRVRQSEKMAAVGEMAAGVAHEFRNPLAAISGSTQLLTQRLQNQPGQEKLLAIITRECDRLEAAVKNFLLFSRPARPVRKIFKLLELWEECVELIRQTPDCTERHRLTGEIPAELEVWADREQLRQVLLNLLSNACQAMPEGGEIICRAAVAAQSPADDGKPAKGEGQPEPAPEAERSSSAKPPGVIIKVSDRGRGIPPEIRDKIFNPYFTTRQAGTGLGLAIVHQLIEGHGGHLQVTSPPDQGTTFTLEL